jgi:HEAT repeat protein
VQRSLQDENGNPEKSYSSLARILRNTGVDKILAHFPASKRDELRSLPPEQLAGEYIQDTALQLAGAKLQTAQSSGDKIMVEEQVIHLLAKSLQATHMADRLAEKLTKFIQEFAVPAHIQEKIREELRWTALNSTKKYTKLMELQHFSSIEFRRLLELLKELSTQRDMERAASLASHYFDFLDDERARIDSSELSRVPELFRLIPLGHSTFAPKTAERLGRTVLREDLSEFIHFQATNALTVLAQGIATFENFQVVLSIGIALETSSHRNPEKHKKCCGIAIPRLLPEAATERIIELYLSQRGDSTWAKNAATLLRYAAPGSINKVFSYLIKEEDARNRLALVRLVSQLGSGTIEVAVKYLEDDRWYVVRNMCGVLAELKDPDLVEHVAPALQHSEKRVQQAALKALVKSRKANAASVLASSLSKFVPDVLGEALDELMFMKDGSAIAPLEDFISNRQTSPAFAKKAIQALGSINDEAALHALVRLYRIEELDRNIRRAALSAIANHRSPASKRILTELAESWGALAAEARNELEKHNSR